MTTANDVLRTLPNGADVLAESNGVVLARWEKDGRPEWITWRCDVGECYWGHYFRSRDAAVHDYMERVADRLD